MGGGGGGLGMGHHMEGKEGGGLAMWRRQWATGGRRRVGAVEVGSGRAASWRVNRG
jgi:hypothetical protein